MKAWVDYIRQYGGDGELYNRGTHYGDWLALDVPSGTYKGATDFGYIATAFYAYSCEILTKTAELLGKTEDAHTYARLHKKILKAFRKEFVTKNGRLAVTTQTACVLALRFRLVKKSQRSRVLALLAELLEKSGGALTTGFVGTPYLCPVLSECGRHDLAVRLFLREEYPSWLYPLRWDATTVWEHWDGIRPDGTFWSPDMNSFNHYAYGCIGEWMMRDLAGLDTDEVQAGYRLLRLAPRPCEGLDFARAELETPYGKAVCGWKKEGGKIKVDITVPCNAKASLWLPVSHDAVTESGYPAGHAEGVEATSRDGNGTRFLLGSGAYLFAYPEREAL